MKANRRLIIFGATVAVTLTLITSVVIGSTETSNGEFGDITAVRCFENEPVPDEGEEAVFIPVGALEPRQTKTYSLFTLNTCKTVQEVSYDVTNPNTDVTHNLTPPGKQDIAPGEKLKFVVSITGDSDMKPGKKKGITWVVIRH